MSIILFIAVLVILIVVHELGHFLVAKLFRIRVDEFGIGYPPRAFVLGLWRGTTYTINWLPFGGFVRIFGERNRDDYTEEEKKVAFVYKPRLVQASVLIAGIVFNLLFAWILFSGTLMLGAPVAISEADATHIPTRLVVSSVVVGSPADAAGLHAGDTLISLSSNKDKITHLLPSTVVSFVESHVGKAMTISYIRSSTSKKVQTVSIDSAQGVLVKSPGTPAIGIAMALIATKTLPVTTALTQGFTTTVRIFGEVAVGLYTFLISVVSGTANLSQVAGPIGIAGMIGNAASVGFLYLLYFTAFISINLAVINLIPLPALDGGRLLFVIIESITRKSINEKVAMWFNVIGFSLLLLLMVVVTYNDVIRLLHP